MQDISVLERLEFAGRPLEDVATIYARAELRPRWARFLLGCDEEGLTGQEGRRIDGLLSEHRKRMAKVEAELRAYEVYERTLMMRNRIAE